MANSETARPQSIQSGAKVGIVSLGCPKALVDSERIITKLRAEGYEIAPDYNGADAVIVNTCGFIDSAKAESLDAIGEAMKENGKVIVTGCLGVEEKTIRDLHPDVMAVTGPHQYEQVMNAVHEASPPAHDPFVDLVPPEGIRLTPRHYAYLKISEGCNHRCKFCIIPSMRGDLASRPANEVYAEAERLVNAGVKEILMISQDTSAYGLDLKYAESSYRGKVLKARMTEICDAIGDLGAWLRLHYVYPYPHVDEIIQLMADGKVLPYLDIPFQHASPSVLKSMKRPAHDAKTLNRIQSWRKALPDMTIRSTFIVGYPGETEQDFQYLMDWLDEAQLDRVGCFKYEPVEGAAANDLPNQIPEALKQERWERFMEKQKGISEARLQRKVGQTIEVIIDDLDEEGAIARSWGDTPEIDGNVFLEPEGLEGKAVGDIVMADIDEAGEYDLWGRVEEDW